MRIDGAMPELLVKINPTRYKEHLTYERGKPLMYVLLKKALYGTLQATLLFWQNLTKFLEDEGYKVNLYDWCVINKMADGKQCTILWHVDDLKISHENEHVVTAMLDKVTKKYGNEAPLTIKRGKIHDYLGMVIDYSVPGKVSFDMSQYVEDMLDKLPDDMKDRSTATSPAANYLFQVQDAEKLSEERGQLFLIRFAHDVTWWLS